MGRQCEERSYMKGKGGSMHLTDVDKGVMGSYAIIGAHLTIANGTALASKYNNTKEVSIVFFWRWNHKYRRFSRSLKYGSNMETTYRFCL